MGNRSTRSSPPILTGSKKVGCISTAVDDLAHNSDIVTCNMGSRSNDSYHSDNNSHNGTVKIGDLSVSDTTKYMSGEFVVQSRKSRVNSTSECESSVCSSSERLEIKEREDVSFRDFHGTGLPDGIHKWTFHSGDEYNGEWRGGTMHGKGTLHLVESKVVYRGEFRNGVYHGNGEMTYDSGDVFTGTFLGGAKHGQGRVRYSSGKPLLKGIWQNDNLAILIEGVIEINGQEACSPDSSCRSS